MLKLNFSRSFRLFFWFEHLLVWMVVYSSSLRRKCEQHRH